ncbi:MAG: PilZ domain-containing protein [Terriglobales bacterium]
MSYPDRRQFERLALPDDAVALDDSGRRLGLVSHAGGGGMQIRLEVPPEEFAIGMRLRVNVREPATNINHSIDVVVRYIQSNSLGVEFVTGKDRK